MSSHAVVTGGASGIGLTVVRDLVAEGADVSVLDHDAFALERERPDLEALGRGRTFLTRCDVTDEAAVGGAIAEAVETLGTITGLVNAAGIVEKSAAIATSLASWRRVIDVNLTGTFLVTRECASLMIEAGQGAIVNIASVDAHAADRHELSYNASKSGVLGLTRSFAVELAELGVRCNSVSPGYVLTAMTTQATAADPRVLHVLDGRFERVPMRRAVTPNEISHVVRFLLSDGASGVTGQDLIVDGGMMADVHLVAALRQQASSVVLPSPAAPSESDLEKR